MSEETMNKESATDLNEYDVTPDGFVTEKEMQEGGYTKAEIYPLRYFRAKILYDLGLPVYMLYRDNTESESRDRPKDGRGNGRKQAVQAEKGRVGSEYEHLSHGRAFCDVSRKAHRAVRTISWMSGEISQNSRTWKVW